MTLEFVRSFWIDFDYGRLITDHRFETREVSGPEGGVMLGWGQASTCSRLAMERSGVIWRSSPLEAEDLVALGEVPIYARDCVAVKYDLKKKKHGSKAGVKHPEVGASKSNNSFNFDFFCFS